MEIKAVEPIETEFIALKSLTEQEAREVTDMFVSKEGKIGYLASRRLLIIHDHPANISAIKKALAEVDTDPVNIRIRIDFDQQRNTDHGEVGVSVESVVVRRKDGDTDVNARLRGHLGQGRTQQNRSTSSSILTTSGREASIWVGETVYDDEWVYRQGLARGWWERGTVERNFGVSLWARPRVLADGTIEVTVFPRIMSRGKKPRSIDVQELSTKVVARDNMPVRIGGLDDNHSESYRRLFGVGRIFNGHSLNIILTPSILRPVRQPSEHSIKEKD